jgi:hypothetical protein
VTGRLSDRPPRAPRIEMEPSRNDVQDVDNSSQNSREAPFVQLSLNNRIRNNVFRRAKEELVCRNRQASLVEGGCSIPGTNILLYSTNHKSKRNIDLPSLIPRQQWRWMGRRPRHHQKVRLPQGPWGRRDLGIAHLQEPPGRHGLRHCRLRRYRPQLWYSS